LGRGVGRREPSPEDERRGATLISCLYRAAAGSDAPCRPFVSAALGECLASPRRSSASRVVRTAPAAVQTDAGCLRRPLDLVVEGAMGSIAHQNRLAPTSSGTSVFWDAVHSTSTWRPPDTAEGKGRPLSRNDSIPLRTSIRPRSTAGSHLVLRVRRIGHLPGAEEPPIADASFCTSLKEHDMNPCEPLAAKDRDDPRLRSVRQL
jgi:hypothetical protein